MNTSGHNINLVNIVPSPPYRRDLMPSELRDIGFDIAAPPNLHPAIWDSCVISVQVPAELFVLVFMSFFSVMVISLSALCRRRKHENT